MNTLHLMLIILFHVDIVYTYYDSVKLKKIEEALYEHMIHEYPEQATSQGVDGVGELLESFEITAYDKRYDINKQFLSDLEMIDYHSLSIEDQIQYDILHDHISTYVDGYKWKDYGLNPISYLEKPVFFYSDWIKFEAPNPFHDIINNHKDKLTKLVKQVGDLTTMIRTAVRLNRTNHLLSMKSSIDKISSRWFSIFLRPLSKQRRAIYQCRIDPKCSEVLGVLEKLNIAVKNMTSYLRQEYFANTRVSEGVYSWDNGIKYYEACLKYYTGLSITAKHIHSFGLDEVERISNQMQQLKTNDSNIPLANSIPQANLSTEKIMSEYRDILDNRILPVIGTVFYNRTEFPIRFQANAQLEAYGFMAIYVKDTMYVNPKSRIPHQIVPLMLHESLPGHHFQEHYIEMSSLPKYRRWLLLLKRYAVPFTYPEHSAFIEGWAQYSEYLGEEMGLYQNTSDLYGRLQMDMWRACRMVVDTGIHTYRWTKQQAVNYMVNYTDMTQSFISMEVNRMITWPGYLCTYKIGERQILKLRRLSEELLGQIFDIKEFHHEVLKRGPISLNVLDKIIRRWISSKLNLTSSSTENACTYLSSFNAYGLILLLYLFSIVIV